MKDTFQFSYPCARNNRSQPSHHQSTEQNEDLREQDGMKEQSPGWDTEVDNMPHQILLYQDIAVFIYVTHTFTHFLWKLRQWKGSP